MTKSDLVAHLNEVQAIARASKWRRLVYHPVKYLYAILFRKIFYRISRQEKAVNTKAFFGKEMHLLLPSSTDIYLTGGKSHPSEINLARFIIHYLEKGDFFLDIGAHYGFYSLLAAELLGKEGRIVAFEASPGTFEVLQKNCNNTPAMEAWHLAVSDSDAEITFYEFPNLYSEYNTMDTSQFEGKSWFGHVKPRAVSVRATTLDHFFEQEQKPPRLIKIDVEGAEDRVLRGAEKLLTQHAPIVVMEYLSESRGNAPHLQAEKWMRSIGYTPFAINANGQLAPVTVVEEYLATQQLDSDNIAFVRS